ncbi:unnamed protein product, partial [Ambrosiozyma monospora]
MPKIVPLSSSSGSGFGATRSGAAGFLNGHHKSKSWAGSGSVPVVDSVGVSGKQLNSRYKFNRSRINDKLPTLPAKDKPTTITSSPVSVSSSTSTASGSGPLSPSLPPPPPSHLLRLPPSATVKHMLNMLDDDDHNNNHQIQTEPIPQKSTFLELPLKLDELTIPPRSPARLKNIPARSIARGINVNEEKSCAGNGNGNSPSLFERRAHARSSSLGAVVAAHAGVSKAAEEVESCVDGGDSNTAVSAHSGFSSSTGFGSASFMKSSKSYRFNLSDKHSSRVSGGKKLLSSSSSSSSSPLLRSIDNLSTNSNLLAGSNSASSTSSSGPRSRSSSISNSMRTRKFTLSSVSRFKPKSKARFDNNLNQRDLVSSSSSRKSSLESVSSSSSTTGSATSTSTTSSSLNSDDIVVSSSSSTHELTDSSSPLSTQSSTFSNLNSHGPKMINDGNRTIGISSTTTDESNSDIFGFSSCCSLNRDNLTTDRLAGDAKIVSLSFATPPHCKSISAGGNGFTTHRCDSSDIFNGSGGDGKSSSASCTGTGCSVPVSPLPAKFTDSGSLKPISEMEVSDGDISDSHGDFLSAPSA